MKVIMMIGAALLAIAASSAMAQDKCSEGYNSCMNSCLSVRQGLTQDRCIEACQAKNTQCYDQALGPRPQAVETAAQPTTQPTTQPSAALATGTAVKTEKTPQAPAAPTAKSATP